MGDTPGFGGREVARAQSLGQGSTWPRDSGFSGPSPGSAPHQLSALGKQLNLRSLGFPTCELGMANLPQDAERVQRKSRHRGTQVVALMSFGSLRTTLAAGVGDSSRRVGASVSFDWRSGVLRPQAGPWAGVTGIS